MAFFVPINLQVFSSLVFFAALNTLYTVHGIPLTSFYPFGNATTAVGETDLLLPPNDDGSSPPISLSRVFPFFGSDHFTVYVNNNGDISFTTSVVAFTPEPFPLEGDLQLISPYWGDVDTTRTGRVWYRESFNGDLLTRARNEIRAAFPIIARSFSPSLLFIATWDHVGYFQSHDDKTNTFQCIMVTDGFQSFVIFLYADGLIQWTTGDASGGMNGLGGTPAQVGFNAGDGERFFVVEGSRTAEVIKIVSKSSNNVDIPGMFVFQVNEIEGPGECDPDLNGISISAELTLVPRLGSVLGGTPVLISGHCINPENVIWYICSFDGRRGRVRGVYYNDRTVLCISPIMTTIGRVTVELELRTNIENPLTGENMRLTSSASFQTVSPERAHQIEFENMDATEDNPLLFKPSDRIRITWVPEEMLPPYLTSNQSPADQVNVDIQIYEVSVVGRDWRLQNDLTQTNVPNSGSLETVLPSQIDGLECESELSETHVCPIAIRVSVTTGTPLATAEGDEIDNRYFRGRNTIGIWSGIAFIQSNGSINERQFSMVCIDWANPAPQEVTLSVSDEIWRRLPPCPPLLSQARLDPNFALEVMESIFGSNSIKYREQSMKFFHPNIMECYRQRIPDTSSLSPNNFGQQCCYNTDGFLVTGQPGGGSGDKMSPVVNYNQHVLTDLLPYIYCCKLSLQCDMYYEQRPSSDLTEGEYMFPFPALLFGDPHISTLDSLQCDKYYEQRPSANLTEGEYMFPFPVLLECEENMCQNNATCTRHVRTFICDCPPGIIGTFCELNEPPFDIAFINSSPRVSEDTVKVNFTSNKPIESARCFLSKLVEEDCSKGYVTFSNVPPGSYVLHIIVKATNGERVVERRQVHVGKAEEVCAVHLINKGLSVSRGNAVIEFSGSRAVTSNLCRIDGRPFQYCQSPVIFYDLEVGVHHLHILPQCKSDGSRFVGDGLTGKRLSLRFSVLE